MTPQLPAKNPNTNLNKIEHAILRGITEEREQLTEEITNTPRDRLWSSEALALMQNSGHTIRGNKISETTIKHIDKKLRDTLIKAINSKQQTRRVAHLPRETTAAFDGPIYHLDPDDGSKRLCLWKPSKVPSLQMAHTCSKQIRQGPQPPSAQSTKKSKYIPARYRGNRIVGQQNGRQSSTH
ncbi:hypothetical protein T492DRAFT_1122636 [Pavlovales sp. CCMP2436]|nr:hypothetical protein T492DRAFT_1122636 [Pavlovales sp. CCMP2436]